MGKDQRDVSPSNPLLGWTVELVDARGCRPGLNARGVDRSDGDTPPERWP